MDDETQPLISQPIPSNSTNERRLDDSTSFSFFRQNFSNGGHNLAQYMKDRNKLVEVAVYPWKWLVRKTYMKECLAEFFGTFLLVVIGNGAIAQASLGAGNFGTFQSINIGYALGLTIAVYASIGVSGGHLNPAVSLAMAVRGRLPWLMVVPYMIAQTLGAFFSSFFVFGVYRDAIYNAGGMTNHTAGIFATYPAPYLTIAGGFFDQLFGTFILLIGIFAITDSKNSEVTSGLKPFMIGVVLWAIGSSFGMNAGYAVNPARDFGPRLFTAIVGWGPQVFVCDFCGVIRHWWWVPIVAPMVGGLFAAFFYWFFIEAHHPTQNRSLVISDDFDDLDVNDDDSINGEKKA